MSDAQQTKEEVTRYDLVITDGGGELITRDTGEFVVYAAYQAACVERDMYKAQAEINAQTVIRQAHHIRSLLEDEPEVSSYGFTSHIHE